MDFMELAAQRYSVRSYSDKPVEQEKIDLILKAVQLDKCVLYAFRCAVAYAKDPNPNPENYRWWYFCDDNNKMKGTKTT